MTTTDLASQVCWTHTAAGKQRDTVISADKKHLSKIQPVKALFSFISSQMAARNIAVTALTYCTC